MSPIMNDPQVDVAELQNRDPSAWTSLLRGIVGTDDVVVTAVTAEPLRTPANAPYDHRVSRYQG